MGRWIINRYDIICILYVCNVCLFIEMFLIREKCILIFIWCKNVLDNRIDNKFLNNVYYFILK